MYFVCIMIMSKLVNGQFCNDVQVLT